LKDVVPHEVLYLSRSTLNKVIHNYINDYEIAGENLIVLISFKRFDIVNLSDKTVIGRSIEQIDGYK
jgi:hypothetical protein